MRWRTNTYRADHERDKKFGPTNCGGRTRRPKPAPFPHRKPLQAPDLATSRRLPSKVGGTIRPRWANDAHPLDFFSDPAAPMESHRRHNPRKSRDAQETA